MHLIEFARFTHDGHVTKIRTGAIGRVYTVVGEMRDEMAGTPSTSGSRVCCRAAFFLPPGQSTPRRSPALAMVSSSAR